jgi:regulator of sigma E protease
VEPPGGEGAPREVELVPRYDEQLGFYTIGVLPASDPAGTLAVAPGSPAAEAGLASGDRLVAVRNAPPSPTLDEALYLATRQGGPLALEVERDGRTLEAEIRPRAVEGEGPALLGVTPPTNLVAGLRGSARDPGLGLREGDRLVRAQGRPILRTGDLVLALAEGAAPLALEVERDGARRALQGPTLGPAEALAFARDVGLDVDQESTRVVVREGSAAAAAGLVDGDRVLRVDGADVARFDDLKQTVARAGDAPIKIAALREAAGAEPRLLEVEATPAPLTAFDYGLGLEPAHYVFRTNSPGQALRIGVQASWKFAKEAWLSLKRILLGQVSAKNVGGIVTIGVVSHSWASLGLAKLFFFLCMLSMNLAFINVLPIPVLDGGHLLFLIVEKIKGSPVSERVLSYSQIVGLVLIVTLMAYVTFNDIVRWF